MRRSDSDIFAKKLLRNCPTFSAKTKSPASENLLMNKICKLRYVYISLYGHSWEFSFFDNCFFKCRHFWRFLNLTFLDMVSSPNFFSPNWSRLFSVWKLGFCGIKIDSLYLVIFIGGVIIIIIKKNRLHPSGPFRFTLLLLFRNQSYRSLYHWFQYTTEGIHICNICWIIIVKYD